MPNSKKKSTIEIASELIEPITDEMNLEIWDVRFEKEGSQWYLRYFIDSEEGITIDECDQVCRKISDKLDEVDPISHSYILEVGSPGIERELKKDEHFEKHIGDDVTVRLIRPVDGLRDFVGELVSKEDSKITIIIDEDIEMTFDQKEAAFIKLYVDF